MSHRHLGSVLCALALLVASATSVLASASPSGARTVAPAVTKLSRHGGPTTGGGHLTITGRGFVHLRAVRFGRTKARYSVVSSHRLTVRIPAHRAGRVDVVVTTAAGASRHVSADRYRYVAGGVRRTWRSALMPLPADADTTNQHAVLTDVSCASSGLCAAIGGYQAAGQPHALLAVYAGGHWTSADPEPAGASGIAVRGVSCAGTTCAAVGEILTGGHWEGLLDVWTGGAWHQSIAPHPAEEPALLDQLTDVDSVSCWATGGCVAVGYYEAAAGSPGSAEVAAWTWAGGTWTALTLPLPADADTVAQGQFANVDHVGCSSATSCVAGGDYLAGGTGVGLLERYDGSSWHATAAPLPSGGSLVHVNDAACTGSSCVVAGQFYDQQFHEVGLLEVWHGGAWTRVAAPLPADAGTNPWVVLEGASCHATATCVVVGSYLTTGNLHHALVETVDGTSATAVTPSRPATGDGDYEELRDVSCHPGCVTAGDFEDTTPTIRSYLGVGATWTPATPVVPGQTASEGSDYFSVSCVANGFCMAVGDTQAADGSWLVQVTHD